MEISKGFVALVFLVCIVHTLCVNDYPHETYAEDTEERDVRAGTQKRAFQTKGCDRTRVARKPLHGEDLLFSEEGSFVMDCLTTSPKTPACPICTVSSSGDLHPNVSTTTTANEKNCIMVANFAAVGSDKTGQDVLKLSYNCTLAGISQSSFSYSVTWRKSSNGERCNLQSDCSVSQQVCDSRTCQCPAPKPIYKNTTASGPGCFSESYPGEPCFKEEQCSDVNSDCIQNHCRCKDGYRQEGTSCNSSTINAANSAGIVFFFYVLFVSWK